MTEYNAVFDYYDWLCLRPWEELFLDVFISGVIMVSVAYLIVLFIWGVIVAFGAVFGLIKDAWEDITWIL